MAAKFKGRARGMLNFVHVVKLIAVVFLSMMCICCLIWKTTFFMQGRFGSHENFILSAFQQFSKLGLVHPSGKLANMPQYHVRDGLVPLGN